MAEAFAVVGIVASIAQLIDIGTKVLKRLSDLHSSAKQLPKTLRDVQVELPLLLHVLQHVEQEVEQGQMKPDAQQSILPIFKASLAEIESLDAILQSNASAVAGSRLGKLKKAILSPPEDKKVEKIHTTLHRHIRVLTFYYTVSSAKYRPPKDHQQNLDELRSWLAAPDPSSNYQNAMDVRHANTGSWFLDGRQYDAWLHEAASFLWLHGIPGCGKTILCSAVIQNLRHLHDKDPGRVVCYFYFHFQDAQKQTSENMLKSLVWQLCQHCMAIPNMANGIFAQSKSQHPFKEQLLEMLKCLIQEFPHVYIVLDALDECTRRDELLRTLKTLTAWDLQNLHLLLTSRRERDIEESLGRFADGQNFVPLELATVDTDILAYVSQRLAEDVELARWNAVPEIRQEIELIISSKANGMFRWAVCQLDALAGCRTRKDLRDALNDLPETLDETYDRILNTVKKRDTANVRCVLQWLAFSDRPLYVEEMAEALATDPECKPYYDRERLLEDPTDVLDMCAGLLTVIRPVIRPTPPRSSYAWSDFDVPCDSDYEDEADYYQPEPPSVPSSSKIQVLLAHFSVKEYLTSERIKTGVASYYSVEETSSRALIAQSCLAYMLHHFSDEKSSSDDKNKPVLWIYAAALWPKHMRGAGANQEQIMKLARELFSKTWKMYHAWITQYYLVVEYDWESRESLDDYPSPLNMASCLGLIEVVQYLIKDLNVDVNEDSESFGTALHGAVAESHTEVVRLLIKNGADTTLVHGSYSRYGSGGLFTPLSIAILGNKTAIIKDILELAGAALLDDGGIATWMAVNQRNKEVLTLLLKRGFQKNTDMLSQAAYLGCEGIVLQLIASGVKVNIRQHTQGDKETDAMSNSSPLAKASGSGHYNIVRLLLQHGAEINFFCGSTALFQAASHGYEKVVKALVDAGADVNVLCNNIRSDPFSDFWCENGHNGTALDFAAGGGHERVVSFLLENGAKVDVDGHCAFPALVQASNCGYLRIVEMLLAAGADVHHKCRNQQGGDALLAACRNGQIEIIELLIAHGADVNAVATTIYDKHPPRIGAYQPSTALTMGLSKKNTAVIKLLLTRGADVNLPCKYRGTPLALAIELGLDEIVQFLLRAGADPNMRYGPTDSPLYAAAKRGQYEIVHTLLACNANVNSEGGRAETALCTAINGSRRRIAELLLARGADPNYPSDASNLPLHAAANRGNTGLIDLLIENGAQLNGICAPHAQSAVSSALSMGKFECVKDLLNRGAHINIWRGHAHDAFVSAISEGFLRQDGMFDTLLLKALAYEPPSCHAYSGFLEAAARHGQTWPVQRLITLAELHKLTPNIFGDSLIFAIAIRHEEIAQILLEAGAPFNTYSEEACKRLNKINPGPSLEHGNFVWCSNPLITAAANDADKTLAQLLDLGMDVNAVCKSHGTVLSAAAALASFLGRASHRVIGSLLEKGADPNMRSEYHGTALAAAAYGADADVIELMIKHGADVNLLGWEGRSPLSIAAYANRKKTVKLLLENGADVNAQCGGPYENALSAAASKGNFGVGQILIKHGAEINPIVEYYANPLGYALATDDRRMTQLLLRKGAKAEGRVPEHIPRFRHLNY